MTMKYILLVYTEYETAKYIDIYPLNSKAECIRKARYLMNKKKLIIIMAPSLIMMRKHAIISLSIMIMMMKMMMMKQIILKIKDL